MPSKIRVVLADDHPLFREGVVKTLTAEPDFEIVCRVCNVPIEIFAGQVGDDDARLDVVLGVEIGRERFEQRRSTSEQYDVEAPVGELAGKALADTVGSARNNCPRAEAVAKGLQNHIIQPPR